MSLAAYLAPHVEAVSKLELFRRLIRLRALMVLADADDGRAQALRLRLLEETL